MKDPLGVSSSKGNVSGNHTRESNPRPIPLQSLDYIKSHRIIMATLILNEFDLQLQNFLIGGKYNRSNPGVVGSIPTEVKRFFSLSRVVP